MMKNHLAGAQYPLEDIIYVLAVKSLCILLLNHSWLKLLKGLQVLFLCFLSLMFLQLTRLA